MIGELLYETNTQIDVQYQTLGEVTFPRNDWCSNQNIIIEVKRHVSQSPTSNVSAIRYYIITIKRNTTMHGNITEAR